MKAEGWKFPPVREAEAMFEADVAPDWHDGDCCHRCRVQVSKAFGFRSDIIEVEQSEFKDVSSAFCCFELQECDICSC